MVGVQHELGGPGMQGADFAGIRILIRVISGEEKESVYDYEGIVYVWCSLRSYTCSNR